MVTDNDGSATTWLTGLELGAGAGGWSLRCAVAAVAAAAAAQGFGPGFFWVMTLTDRSLCLVETRLYSTW